MFQFKQIIDEIVNMLLIYSKSFSRLLRLGVDFHLLLKRSPVCQFKLVQFTLFPKTTQIILVH